MADMMEFPKTLDEFMEQYKIVDTEQVYTNGTELVPIFRIKQWEDVHRLSAQPTEAAVRKEKQEMICSHYELEMQDKDGNTIVKMRVYSFDEAYYWIDKMREEPLSVVKFILKYPDEYVYGEEKTNE